MSEVFLSFIFNPKPLARYTGIRRRRIRGIGMQGGRMEKLLELV